MARAFRDEDREKDVVSPARFVVGTIRDTDGDRAVVDRTTADGEGLTGEIAEWLGWSDDADDAELRREHVEAYGDGTVRLRDRP
jgi:hypothetical protein